MCGRVISTHVALRPGQRPAHAHSRRGKRPLIVVLHGFPEASEGWRHQLRALVAAGYRVVAPDQRGYGQTDYPEREDAYTIFHMVGDLIFSQRSAKPRRSWSAPNGGATHAARLVINLAQDREPQRPPLA